MATKEILNTKKAIRKAINDRMILLMYWSIENGIADHESDYLKKIGVARTNISNLRKYHQGFTTQHIMKACQLTGASTDFIFGFTNTRLRKPAKPAMDQLKEAVKAVELERRNGKH